ncbi:MAG: membrane protein insertase YidC [Saprospiraceae bacterium]|nr:membrane protein insertase YidC [Saprospiraceae bacterium]
MDKNTLIGFALIFVLLIVWQQFNMPSQEELERQQQIQDSIELAQQKVDAQVAEPEETTEVSVQEEIAALPDSLKEEKLSGLFGPFSNAGSGTEKLITVENELMTLVLTNKGGRIKEVILKEFQKNILTEDKQEVKEELKLLSDEKNRFEYLLPIANLPSGGIRTGDLYFDVQQSGKEVVFRAKAGDGRYFEQKYSLDDNSYRIGYDIKLEGLQNVLANNAEEIELIWHDYLDRIEINHNFERRYSTIYFKPAEESVDYCSCTSDDVEELADQRIKWISHYNQFFNSTLIAKESFASGVLETQVLDTDDEDLKKLVSSLKVPYNRSSSENFAMEFYVGPNEFERLREMGSDLEDIVPFGWSIFGTVNRWIVRPLFNFLSSFIGSKGIVILVLTFMVKLCLYPLTYRMLYSQSKMGALKPQIEKLKEKVKDPQQQQVETMKMYREFGVNPLGGCMPMLMQMPIWIALYRFFPASIEFRQASFLWATDLSSYDVMTYLPFEIPFVGAHISLFTILWAGTTLIYTYYNTKHMDMSANPAMKYMQYFMPIMFLGFFNTYASGLTCYLFFSNLFNIGQTVVTKNYIIDQDKVRAELEENKKKPKKKSGFQSRLEAAMKEQQRVQAQRESQKGKKKRK